MGNKVHSAKTLEHWPYQTYNWGRWTNGKGTLNLADNTATKRGFNSVKDHEVFTLGSPLSEDYVTGEANYDSDYHYELLRAGQYEFAGETEPVFEAGDRFSIATHGMTNTHIDAFCHVGHRGQSFNGHACEDVVTLAEGVKKYTIIDLGSLVTRAWLIDVPAQRGLDFLIPGDPVVPEDLMPFSNLISAGDVLVIRTGRFAAPLIKPDSQVAQDNHGNWSGLHVDCVDLISDWDISSVATDGPGDNFPSTYEGCSVPIHILMEVYLGLPLIHHLSLEALAKKLSSRDDKSFLLTVAPLQISSGTGSPVSPIAVT